MTVAVADLQALADSLQAVPAGPTQVAPGEPAKVSLVPAASELQVTDLIDSALSVLWLGKGVLFADELLLKDASGQPADLTVADLEGTPNVLGALPVLGLNVGDPVPPGVPGLVGQLDGTLQIPVQVPVTLTVSWRVLDEDGVELQEGFVAPDGVVFPDVSFVFFPEAVELTPRPPEPVRRFVEAAVRLTAGGVSFPDPAGPAHALPPIEFEVFGIPIPTLLALFRHADFATSDGFPRRPGYVLLVVPHDSPLEGFDAVVQQLLAIGALASSLPVSLPLPPVLASLTQLLQRTVAQPRFGFARADLDNEVKRLEDVFMDGPGPNLDAAESISSLMFVSGSPDRTAQCFVRQNCDEFHPSITVNVDPELVAVISNLHDFGGFGDRLSSLRLR